MPKEYLYVIRAEPIPDKATKKIQVIPLDQHQAATILHVDRKISDAQQAKDMVNREKALSLALIRSGILAGPREKIRTLNHEGHAGRGDLLVEEKDGHRRLDEDELRALMAKHRPIIQ